MMRYEHIFLFGLCFILLACSETSNPSYSFRSYGDPDKCWINEGKLDAYLVLYDLGNHDNLGNREYTFDFVSKRCRTKDFEVGEPPLFVVAFSPSEKNKALESLGINGNLQPNQISPMPSIDQIIGIYSIEGSAKLENSIHGQLRISNLTIIHAKKLNITPVEFLRKRIF